jgi:SAM-dependent methyltransferase
MEGPVSQHHSVRQSYDAVAEEYAAGFRDELASKPLDRALLACLAEQAADGAPIADLGCGPGHVAAWLAARRVATVGIDLSPAMIAVGRGEYPQAEFREGTCWSFRRQTVSSRRPSRSTRSSISSPASCAAPSMRSTPCRGPARFPSSPFMSARR